MITCGPLMDHFLIEYFYAFFSRQQNALPPSQFEENNNKIYSNRTSSNCQTLNSKCDTRQSNSFFFGIFFK